MAESYKRSLRPWRMYLPTQGWFLYRKRMCQLDGYVKGRLRERWCQRQAGERTGEQQDIADLLMSATEVSPAGLLFAVLCISAVPLSKA